MTGSVGSALKTELRKEKLEMSVKDVINIQSERMNTHRELPDVSRAMVALEQEIKVDPVLRELVKLRGSILNGCAYCIDMHSKRARKAGESEQRIYMVAAWQDAPFFSERERAALALTDAVTLVAGTHVPAEVFENAARRFNSAEVAHLIWQIASINLWNRVAIATRAPVGDYRP